MQIRRVLTPALVITAAGVLPDLDGTCTEPVGGVVGFCDVFLIEFAALWRQGGVRPPPPEVISDRLAGELAPYLAALGTQELPVEAVYLFLSGWIRLYGMVAMEVFGHLSWALTDVEPLFETDMAAYFHQLTSALPGRPT